MCAHKDDGDGARGLCLHTLQPHTDVPMDRTTIPHEGEVDEVHALLGEEGLVRDVELGVPRAVVHD